MTNPSNGVYCIALAPEIDPATAVAIVAPDFVSDSTTFGSNAAQAIVEWDSDGCPGIGLEVLTGFRDELTGTGGFVDDVHNTARNQGFSILVP